MSPRQRARSSGVLPPFPNAEIEFRVLNYALLSRAAAAATRAAATLESCAHLSFLLGRSRSDGLNGMQWILKTIGAGDWNEVAVFDHIVHLTDALAMFNVPARSPLRTTYGLCLDLSYLGTTLVEERYHATYDDIWLTHTLAYELASRIEQHIMRTVTFLAST